MALSLIQQTGEAGDQTCYPWLKGDLSTTSWQLIGI